MRPVAMSAAVLLTAALASPAAAQDRPAAYANAEACLVQNVDTAVAASSGASDAAQFLLTYLCANPVSAATTYETNSRLLASGRGMIDTFAAMMPAMTQPGEVELEMDEESEADEDETAMAAAAADAAAAEAAEALDEAGDTPVFGDPEGPPAPPLDPLKGISVDPVTGRFVVVDNPVGPVLVTLMDYAEATARMMSSTAPIFLRERAAQLVVERRRR